MTREPMPISSLWFQGAVLTYLFGFTVLGLLAYLVYRDQPPIPTRVLAENKVLFTAEDIVAGMNVFQRYGLMEYGSVYGHGAYLGPDFTAEYLHNTSEFLIKAYAGAPVGGLSSRERVAAELHKNTYNAADDSLVWSGSRAAAHRMMEEHYRSIFLRNKPAAAPKLNGLRMPTISANSPLFLPGQRGHPLPIVPDTPTRTRTIGRPSRWQEISSPPTRSPGA
jgi:nitric oxide reductase subunit B